MAKRRINPSFTDITGKIGDLVHYTRNGKALTRRTPVRTKPPRAGELVNQSRFRQAQIFAKAALTVPAQRARYEKAAAGLDASAYNMAVSDYYHVPEVGDVDISGYRGKSGELIRVRVEEGRIGAAEVRVAIASPAETILEEGTASVERDGVTWWYGAQRDLAPGQALWITVTAFDQPGHRATKTVRHVSGV